MEELKTQLSEIEDVIASYESQIEIYHTYKFEVLKKMYPSYKDYIERLMNVADYYILLEVYVEDFGIRTFIWDEKYNKRVITFHNCIINGGIKNGCK
jgi:hypothetical protein